MINIKTYTQQPLIALEKIKKGESDKLKDIAYSLGVNMLSFGNFEVNFERPYDFEDTWFAYDSEEEDEKALGIPEDLYEINSKEMLALALGEDDEIFVEVCKVEQSDLIQLIIWKKEYFNKIKKHYQEEFETAKKEYDKILKSF